MMNFNKSTSQTIIGVLIMLCLQATMLVAQTNYYIDPTNGNDSNIGNIVKPFKTLSKARDFVKTVNANMTGNITIYLRGGDYQLSESLIFGVNDSGKNGFNVIYKAYNDEKPVITGGKQITGWTQVSGKNYWVADVPTSAGFASYFRNIWVNGKRAVQARSGFITFHAMNYDDPNTAQVRDGFIVKSADIKDYTNLSDMRIFQCGVFKHVEIPPLSILPITSTEKAIVLKQSSFLDWTNTYTYESPYTLRIINAFEELDEGGEFYLNKATRKIYYYPRTGENLNTVKIIAPSIDGLLKLQGSATTTVSNIQFEGLRFEYGNLSRLEIKEFGRSQADLYADYTAIEGQITLQYTDNISFKKCRFEHLGSTGIYLPDNNNNTLIEGNVFNDLTATAVLIGKDMTPSVSANNNTTITNNVIRSIGADFYQASGIYANTSKNLTVTYNDVADVAYFGINQRYQNVSTNFVGNTQIKYNRVTNYATASKYGFGIGDEVAAFYFFGVQNSTMSNNYAQYAGNKNIAGIFRQDQYGLNNNWTNNVADCKTCDRSLSWYNLQTGGVVFNNNFANVDGEFKDLPTATNANLFIEKNAPAWSVAAQAIIDGAGLQPAYRYLLNGFGADVYDFSPVPEIKHTEWSNELFDYLANKRVSFTKSTDYFRRVSSLTPSSNVNLELGTIKLLSPSFGYAAVFRGAFYSNETIRFNALFNESGTGKQIVSFRGESCTKHHLAQANYHFLFTKNTIELLRRNHDGSTTTLIGTNGLLRNTVSYTSELYNSSQLVEITTQNQANGVKIGLKIGGVTVVDMVDNVAGYLTNAGFLMFNAGKSTGTIYIGEPEMILGVDEKKTEIVGVLYPNPNDGNVLHLKIEENISRCELYDNNGKVYSLNPVSKQTNEYLIRPINTLNNGIYFLKIQSEKGKKIYKVLVQ
jgi:hypothetical protein